jgi:hypothetical protein
MGLRPATWSTGANPTPQLIDSIAVYGTEVFWFS